MYERAPRNRGRRQAPARRRRRYYYVGGVDVVRTGPDTRYQVYLISSLKAKLVAVCGTTTPQRKQGSKARLQYSFVMQY